MKKYIHIFVASVILAGMLLCLPFVNASDDLAHDVLRVHILANSDSAVDQNLKLCVRDRVIGEFSDLYDGCPGKAEAVALTKAHLDEIEAVAEDEVWRQGFSYPVHAEVCEMYFDTRRYDGFTMPAGQYEALRLTIGAGEGKNWWCVMYPALCVGAASDESLRTSLSGGEYRVVTVDRYDLRFKVVEYWTRMRSWLDR